MHKRQKLAGMEHGVVAQCITEDEFWGSTLDLLQANYGFEQPGSPALSTKTQLRGDQRQVKMQVHGK